MSFHSTAIAVAIAMLIHVPQNLRADDELLKLAVAEARKIELRPNYPLDEIKRSVLMVHAASLQIKRDRKTATKWLDEAEKLLSNYDSTGKALVPIVFPVFRQAITTGTSEGDFSQIPGIVTERDGRYAFQFVVERLALVNPDLTLQMIDKGCQDEMRESLRLGVIYKLSTADPERALRLFVELPPVQKPQWNFRRASVATLIVTTARALGIQQVPKPVKMLITEFAPIAFDVAKKRGLRGEFSLFGMSGFGVAWLHIDREAATPHLKWLISAVKTATIPPDASWEDRWKLQVQVTRDRVRVAGLHQVLGDRAASDAAFAEAVAGSLQLVKMVATQPERKDKGRYSFTFGDIATGLPRLSLPVSERIVSECKKVTEFDCGDAFLLELISCTIDRDRARVLADSVSSPETKSRAYLLIATRPAVQ